MDHRDLRLLDDDALERSPVVANSDMNRERRLPAYRRELGVDVLALLRGADRVVRWLDLCCGTANALFEAAHALGDRAEIVGVDLVGYFAGPPRPPRLRLVAAPATARARTTPARRPWTPTTRSAEARRRAGGVRRSPAGPRARRRAGGR